METTKHARKRAKRISKEKATKAITPPHWKGKPGAFQDKYGATHPHDSGLSGLGDVVDAVKNFVTEEAKNAADVAVSKVEHPGSTAKQLAQVALPVPATAARIIAGENPVPSSKELKVDAWAIPGVGVGGDAAKTAETTIASQAAEHAAKDVVSSAAKGAKDGVAAVARSTKGGIKARGTSAAEKVRTAPERTVQKVKETPGKVKAAPAKAKRAATTSEGRRAAAKSAGGTAVHHPVRTGVGAAAVSPVPLPGEADKRARAFVEGTADALVNHPQKTLETTAHAGLGFLTAPLAVGAAGVDSVKSGSVTPLVEEGKALGEGTIDMTKKLASGDPKQVEETTLQETGLTPFLPVPHLIRRVKGSDLYEETRGKVRAKVEDQRAKGRDKKIAAEKAAQEAGEFQPRKKAKKIKVPVEDSARPGEKYVSRKAGRLIEKNRERHYVAREVARMEHEGHQGGKAASESVAKPLRKSKGTNQTQQNDADALRIFVKHGLPSDEKTALAFIRRLHDQWPEIKYGDTPAGVHLDRDSTRYILDHPEIFRGKRGEKFFEAVREFEKQAKSVGTSQRNRYLAQVDNLINPILKEKGQAPILKPEEMVTPEMAKFLPKRDKQWTRTEALDYLNELKPLAGKLRAEAKALERDAKRKLEPARRKTLRSLASEAEARGGAKVRVSARDREILKGDPAYMAAVKRSNAASRELTSAQRAYGNYARNSENLYPAEAAPIIDRVNKAKANAEAAKAALEAAKVDVRRRANVEAGKAARGEPASPLAELNRGPQGSLAHLEDRAGRVKELEVAEAQARADIKQAHEAARQKRAEAKEAETHLRGLSKASKKLMRPPEHGGPKGGVSTTEAVAWTPEQEAYFVKRAQVEGRKLGLRDPAAYVADRLPSSIKGTERLPAIGNTIPLRKIWPSQGLAARSGNAESSFESLIHHSIEAPRSRAAMVRGLNRIFDKASRKVDGKRYLTTGELEHAINTHKMPPDVIPVRVQMLKALLEGDHPVDAAGYAKAVAEEIEHGQKLVSSSADELRGEIEASKAAGLTNMYAPMNSAAIHELSGHMQGVGGVTTMMGHASNFATRLILNSPAFEASQFAQEGLPMAAALGRNIVHVPRAIAALREINKLDPESQAQIRAVVGSSAGLLGSPSLRALRSDGYLDPIRVAGSKSAWRHTWELVNGDKLSGFDKERAGRFREVAAIAKTEGDFRRAQKGFEIWRKSTNNLFKNEEFAVEQMKGMTPGERALYVTSHPRLADELQKDMNNIAGNWNSYTVFEKHIAPFFIFYPFQRYSVLWTLYHFPLDHPVVATALATLGAVNAHELNRLAAASGSTPSVVDYTKPVVVGPVDKGEYASLRKEGYSEEEAKLIASRSVLPSGQRFFPGLASLQQAALEDKPAEALGTLSPVLSIPIEAATGKNSYTGADLGESGWSFLARQGAGLSPLSRFLGLPDIGQSKSAASQVFGENDPLREERSLFDPYIGQTGQQFANEKRVERKYAEKYGPGRLPSVFENALVQELLYGNNGKPKPEMLPEVIKAIHSNEEAKNFVKRKEAKYRGPEKPFTKEQEKLLEEVENSWQTGPNAKPEKSKDPFGIEGSGEKLKESFGIEGTSSKELKEQFGIE